MSEAPKEAAAPAEAAKGKKSGLIKWVVIGVTAVLVLGGGGAAAWWFFLRTPPVVEEAAGDGEAESGATPADEKEKKPTGEGIVAMDQFLVNLADKEASRFVRVKLAFVVESKKEGEELSKEEIVKARLRSAVLEILAQQTSDKLTTPEGKEELKKLIVEGSNRALGGKKVLDVLFTDFVVQL
jgi:flagellar FliL protein